MLEHRPAPKPGENTWLWLLKIASGVFIFALLVIHLVVNHFIAPEGLLTYADVVRYFQNRPRFAGLTGPSSSLGPPPSSTASGSC